MRRSAVIAIFFVVILSTPTVAQTKSVSSVGNCFLPDDPYPYKLSKSDPLYETARDEHQQHLEDMEKYVNCLDREYGMAYDQLKSSFELFVKNFGRDAVFQYDAERRSRE